MRLYFLVSTYLFISLCSISSVLGQCADWTWAEDGEGYIQYPHSIDNEGNLYIPAGYFDSQAIIGSSITNLNVDNVLVKYDPNGQVLWFVQMDGHFSTRINLVKATNNGKVLVTVEARGTLDVDGIPYQLQSIANGETLIIVQLDGSNGSVDWIQEFPSSSANPWPVGLEVDGNDNIYLGGTYNGDIRIGNTTLNSGHDSRLFLIKMDVNGAILWHRDYPTYQNILYGLDVSPDGTIAISGAYGDGPFDLGGILLQNDSTHFSFVAALDNQGNTLWAKNIRSAAHMQPVAGINSLNEVYITGWYRDTVKIDGMYKTSSGAGSNHFLAKMDANGTVVSMETSGGPIPLFGVWSPELAIDASDHVYWSISVDRAYNTLVHDFVPYPEGTDHLIKYDRFGNILWATSGKGFWETLAVGHDNNIVIQGIHYEPSIAFGSHTVIHRNYHAAYKRDLQEFLIESFDGQPSCTSTASQPNGTCANLGNGWVNEDVTDQLDWNVGDANTLHLAGTGPDAPRLTNQYMYLNAENTNQGQIAELIRPCIDITRHANPHLTFFYHMHGADMGTLHVDVRANGVWTNDVWVKQGQQQANSTDPWRHADVDLTPFLADGIIDIRFRGEADNGDLGNMAIDEVYVLDNPDCDLNVSVSANTTIQQGCDSATLDVTITGGVPNFQAASLTVIGLDQMAGVDPTVIETTWYDDQGNVISSSTGLSMPPITVSPTATTTYTVEVSNYYCSAQGQVTVTVLPCATSIEEDIRFASLQIFPNPTENFINIALDWENTADAHISLLNIQGQTIWNSSEKVHKGTNQFSISTREYAKGIYLLRINLENKQVTRRIIVK